MVTFESTNNKFDTLPPPGRRGLNPPSSFISSTISPTFLAVVFKFLFTLYLLLAILYTTTISFIIPLFTTISEVSFDFNTSLEKPFIHPQAPHFQIIPRLLPSDSKSVPFRAVKIRKNLKGTSVNPEQVIAEDQSSFWASQASGLTLSPSLFNQLPLSSSESFKLFESFLSDTTDWYQPNRPLSPSPYSHNHLLEAPRKTIYSTSNDFFLSKAFGDSLGPSKIIPFYYKANGPYGNGTLEKNDISITTLITSNRFNVFSKLVERYQGPISATVHISDSIESLESTLTSLKELYGSSESMTTWVDIHLVVDPFERQFNMWRNVAKFFSRTKFVMMLDVDFWICTNFRQRILNSPHLMDQLEAGKSAFVVPAFEYTKQSDGVNPSSFPSDKKALMKLVEKNKIGMFHKSWKPGHGSTNYTRFYEVGEQEDVYPASRYTHSYEPYVIYKKDNSPFCDERFIGYGANKAACIFELYLSGISFYILPQDFLVHQSHAYAESTRQHERRFNRKLYADFREEVCFRYLMRFLENKSESISSNEKKTNLVQECSKIKGFQEISMKLQHLENP
ncbi:hypothetical protein O181_009364 [Austropuccinia psidii MF-1]|uniref:Glycosyltransferase family 49 protein n=1 Tax=Austropuccinia psidii MF-1 TaxID=1389203 RepID=A0A9Q3BP74_9BASI|nr:hypothetical protein [Austropuccinia psidii MF-1]